MATIAKIQRKGGVAFKAIIRDRTGRPIKSKTFTRKTDARAWAKRIEGDQEKIAALGAPGAGIRVKQLVREYEEQWSAKDKSTLPRVRWWSDQLGNLMLTDVTGAEIREVLERYAAGKALRGDGIGKDGKPKVAATNRARAPATVNRLRAAGSGLFKFARQRGYVQSNPFQGVASKTEHSKRVRYLDADERNRLLTACDASAWPKLKLLVVLALMTGARLGELKKLRWADIDFDRREALLRDTKNGDDRIVPLPIPSIVELEKHRPKSGGAPITDIKEHRHIGKQPLFQSEWFEYRVTDMRPYWKTALTTAEIEDFRFHDLRHDVASRLVMNGATLHEVASVLGHRSVQTTVRYAHLSVDHQRRLVDRVLGGASS